MSAKGYQEQIPPLSLSAGCGFRKETIARMRRNGQDAPFPVVRGTKIGTGRRNDTDSANHSRSSQLSSTWPPQIELHYGRHSVDRQRLDRLVQHLVSGSDRLKLLSGFDPRQEQRGPLTKPKNDRDHEPGDRRRGHAD